MVSDSKRAKKRLLSILFFSDNCGLWHQSEKILLVLIHSRTKNNLFQTRILLYRSKITTLFVRNALTLAGSSFLETAFAISRKRVIAFVNGTKNTSAQSFFATQDLMAADYWAKSWRISMLWGKKRKRRMLSPLFLPQTAVVLVRKHWELD